MSTGAAIRDYSSALDFLLNRINYERTAQIPYQTTEFRLERMRELVRRLGDPQLRVPAIHVAGTKGKGSTAIMIAAMLQAAGKRTGLYTSPHLERIEERIAINGAPCSPQEFVDLADTVQTVVCDLDREAEPAGQHGPTFFEIITAMAFLHFARSQVEAAVLEVGLGGRLDSTNVCQPAVCVITSISYDHTKQLGNTLGAIAGEKAGIIKSGVPVISGVINPEPRDVIAKVAEQVGAPLIQRGRDFDAQSEQGQNSPERWDRSTIRFRESLDGRTRFFAGGLTVNLPGEHQIANAAVAIATVKTLARSGWDIPEEATRRGLAAARCPARVELVRQNPLVIVDAAHNVASIEALCQTLRGLKRSRRILIFASSRDKDAAGMLRLLAAEFDDILLTCYVHNPRARSPVELQQILDDELIQLSLPYVPRIQTFSDPLAAWQAAQKMAGDDTLVCITGSFFLAAELRPVVADSTA